MCAYVCVCVCVCLRVRKMDDGCDKPRSTLPLDHQSTCTRGIEWGVRGPTRD